MLWCGVESVKTKYLSSYHSLKVSGITLACLSFVMCFHLATGSTLEPVYIMMKKKTPVK